MHEEGYRICSSKSAYSIYVFVQMDAYHIYHDLKFMTQRGAEMSKKSLLFIFSMCRCINMRRFAKSRIFSTRINVLVAENFPVQQADDDIP
jgi:hypothetical protein